jgi:hypothetical protein
MDVDEQPTCGRGLAKNSVLPRYLANVISGMAENLAEHMPALDLSDTAARLEHDAYERLVGQLRRIAAELYVTSSEMAGYRDLPMGQHDEAAMARPAVREAFEEYVKHKQQLLTLLEQSAERHESILDMMRAHGQP